MKVVRHWWNGSWGRLTRRDVYIRTDGHRWEIEARLGGAEGQKAIRPVSGEAQGLTLAAKWMDGPFDWRDLTDAHRPRRTAE